MLESALPVAFVPGTDLRRARDPDGNVLSLTQPPAS